MSEFTREVLLARLEAAKVLCCCEDDAASDWLFDTLQAAWEMVNGPVAEEPAPHEDVVVGWIGVDSLMDDGEIPFYSYRNKPKWLEDDDLFEIGDDSGPKGEIFRTLNLQPATLYEIRRVPHETI